MLSKLNSFVTNLVLPAKRRAASRAVVDAKLDMGE